MAFELPTLPYSKTALGAKGMCEETLDLHHGKHHQAYVTALNGFVEKDPALQGKSLDDIVKSTAAAGGPVFNNAGQHWNHIIFWQSMSPTGGKIPTKLQAKIDSDLGGLQKFKDDFKAAGVSQFGSGWAWLVLGTDGKMLKTRSGDPVRLVDLLESAIERADGVKGARAAAARDAGDQAFSVKSHGCKWVGS